MKHLFLFFAALWMIAAANPASAETRCGWFENPTPANAWLKDPDGLWIISTQGVESDEDTGPWPNFDDKDWVITNAGSYGYGCACMDVVTDSSNPKEKHIRKIKTSRPLPLAKCRDDKALRGLENPPEFEVEPPEPPDIPEP